MINRRGRLFLINTVLAAVVLAGLSIIFETPEPSHELIVITAFVVSWIRMGG